VGGFPAALSYDFRPLAPRGAHHLLARLGASPEGMEDYALLAETSRGLMALQYDELRAVMGLSPCHSNEWRACREGECSPPCRACSEILYRELQAPM